MKTDQYHIDHLVEETQKGNTKAFGELYDIYFEQIHKYIYYKVSQHQVDDLVCTVFIKAWTKIKKYKKSSCPFSSWLFRIAHNTIIDHYRTHKEFYELEEKISDEETFNPQVLTEKKLNSERVHRALKKLNKNHQEIILLKFMNELSNKEIGKMMQMNESNVRTLQFRALKKLKEIMEEQEKRIEQGLEKIPQQQRIGFFRKIFVRSS